MFTRVFSRAGRRKAVIVLERHNLPEGSTETANAL
jgi:hypothetical protein